MLNLYAQNGIVKGKLTEEMNGEIVPLPFANVFLEGTTIGGTSDFDGNYQFSSPAGNYVLTCSFMGYETFKREIQITPGGEITVNIEMKPEGIAIEGVEVTAKLNRESEIALMLEQKEASVIKESIGAKQLSDLGVSDAAAATSKISGVTMNEGSGDVYVRGLGDRYLSTTMNGLPIPSDNVEKKNIDLNLFPTGIIKNVGITKTYSVTGYADQTSGVIDISSKTFSDEITIGVSSGINTSVASVFNNFRATQNAGDITMGFYSKPYPLNEAIQKQSWNTVEQNLPVDYGYSFVAGKKVKLFNHDLSIFGTVSQSGSYEYKTGTYQKYRSNFANEIFNDVEQFKTKRNTTGLLNLAYELRDNSTIQLNNMAILKTTDELYEEGRNTNGYYFEQTNSKEKDSSIFVRDQNIKNTRLFINQLLGTHEIGTRHTLKWAAGYNMVKSDEPLRIRNKVTILDNNEAEFIWVGGYDQRKSTQEISDSEINGYLEDQFRIVDEEDTKFHLNVGGNFRYKNRDFESNAIGVEAKNVSVSSIDNMDEVFLNEALYQDETLELNEKKPDTYNGKLLVMAGYVDAGWQLSKFSGSLGVRYELDNIDIKWNVANYVGREGNRVYDENMVYPSLNLKYQLADNNSLRFAASHTITLPEFKEIAPFEYVSPEGRVIKGNPDLMASKNYNFDLKWEMFPTPKELISATAFYKIINNPINKSQTRGSAGTFFFANTGDQANIYGFEIEGRYFLIKAVSAETPDLKLSANFTKMWFEQDLFEEFQYNNKTTSGLQGASEFIFNGALTYSNNKEKELMATVVGNYSSDKIYALGVPEDFNNSDELYNSAIVEKGFFTLDVVVSKKLTDRISAKVYGKNLLDPKIEQTQKVTPSTTNITRTEVVRSYKKGVQIGLGLNINLN